MRLRVDDYRRGSGGIIFPNPNAPTGIGIGRAEVARLLERHADVPVVIDEAYVDFGGETAIPLIADHPNLLVVRPMRSEEHTSELQSLMRTSYAVFCLTKKKTDNKTKLTTTI